MGKSSKKRVVWEVGKSLDITNLNELCCSLLDQRPLLLCELKQSSSRVTIR